MLLPGADVGFIILMVATSCLGSWPNFFRSFPYGVRPELPFFDFTWTGSAVALTLALMFGNTGFEIPDFFDNMRDLKQAPVLILWSLLAGACLAIGNMFYLQGMHVTGQTTAAPVSNGISLVVGLGLIYSFKGIQSRTDLLLHYLFPGLFLISASVVCAAGAQIAKINHHRASLRRQDSSLSMSGMLHHSSDDFGVPSSLSPSNGIEMVSSAEIDRVVQTDLAPPDLLLVPRGADEFFPEDEEPTNVASELIMKALPGPKAQRSQIHAFFVCAIGGALLGCWRVFSNLALQPQYLTPYSANFLFFSGATLGYLIAGPLLLKKPFTGRPGSVTDYHGMMGKPEHWKAIVSGFLFTFGVCLMFIAEQGTGYAVCFIFSQASPLLVALWGIVYWREFYNTPKVCKIWLGWMFATYLGGLFIILLSHFPVLSLV
jgi:glucose uptake protein GlcU